MTPIFQSDPKPFFSDSIHEEFFASALSELTTVPHSVRRKLASNAKATESLWSQLAELTRKLVSANVSGKVRMSIHQFRSLDTRIPPRVIELMLQTSPLARDVMAAFDSFGISARIVEGMNQANTIEYTRRLRHLVVSLAMCTSGASKFTQLSGEHILKWLNFYWDDEKGFNRPDIFSSQVDVNKKILKEISFTLGDKLKSKIISNFGRIFRNEYLFDVTTNQKTIIYISAGAARRVHKENSEEFLPWVDSWRNWRKTCRPKLSAPNDAFAIILNYVRSIDAGLISPLTFIKSGRPLSLLDSYFETRDSLGKPRFVSTDAIEKVKEYSDFLIRQLALWEPSAKPVPLISEGDFTSYSNDKLAAGAKDKLPEVASMPLPMRLYRLVREILEEGESGWPGRHPLCRTVMDGVSVYVPVMTTLLLVPFIIPARMGQLRRLDSGEGDPERFNGHALVWEPNTSSLAKYWQTNGFSNPYRGFAQRTRSRSVTGFYLNTNKTGKPHVIPWQNAELHKILYDLRLWQERYNPISSHVAPKQYLEYWSNADDDKIDTYPDIIPLFRMPRGVILKYRHVSVFWLDLLFEAQNRWNAKASAKDQEKLVEVDDGGRPTRALYNSHGMRSAGITLLLQAGVPIEIVSKLVAGHASVIMTLYYAKFDPAFVSRTLDEGHRRSLLLTSDHFYESLRNSTLEEARSRTVAGSEDALERAFAKKPLWQKRDYGICPFDGQRCKDGGPCSRRSIVGGVDKSKYDRVEGFDGNCVLCRHFLTGPAFAHGMWSYGNLLVRDLAVLNKRIDALQVEQQAFLVQASQEGLSVDVLAHLQKQVDDIDQVITDIADRQTPLAKSLVQVMAYLEQFEELDKENGSLPKTQVLVAHNDAPVAEWEIISETEQAYRVVHNSQIYRRQHSADAERVLADIARELKFVAGHEEMTLKTRSEAQTKRDILYAVDRILDEVSAEELAAYEKRAITIRQLIPEEVAKKIVDDMFALKPVTIGKNEHPMPALAG